MTVDEALYITHTAYYGYQLGETASAVAKTIDNSHPRFRHLSLYEILHSATQTLQQEIDKQRAKDRGEEEIVRYFLHYTTAPEIAVRQVVAALLSGAIVAQTEGVSS